MGWTVWRSKPGESESVPSRPALQPTQPPVQWVPASYPGGKTAGAWRYRPLPPVPRCEWVGDTAPPPICALALLLKSGEATKFGP